VPEEEAYPKDIQIGNYIFRLTKNPDGSFKSKPLPNPIPFEKPDTPIPIPFIPKGGGRILGIFDSESSPGDKHYVILSPSGTIYCTCPGYRSPNKCWHYRGMMKILEDIPVGKILEPFKVGFTRKEVNG